MFSKCLLHCSLVFILKRKTENMLGIEYKPMPEWLQEIKTEIKTSASVFYLEVFISCNHEGEVCILFKSMPIKTDSLRLLFAPDFSRLQTSAHNLYQGNSWITLVVFFLEVAPSFELGRNFFGPTAFLDFLFWKSRQLVVLFRKLTRY